MNRDEWCQARSNFSKNDLCTRGCSSVVVKDTFYVFAVWRSVKGIPNIHQLNLNSYAWSDVNQINADTRPLCKAGSGIVGYGEEMLYVMGGYGYLAAVRNFQQQLGSTFLRDEGDAGWTNEIHIFNIQYQFGENNNPAHLIYTC